MAVVIRTCKVYLNRNIRIIFSVPPPHQILLRKFFGIVFKNIVQKYMYLKPNTIVINTFIIFIIFFAYLFIEHYLLALVSRKPTL